MINHLQSGAIKLVSIWYLASFGIGPLNGAPDADCHLPLASGHCPELPPLPEDADCHLPLTSGHWPELPPLPELPRPERIDNGAELTRYIKKFFNMYLLLCEDSKNPYKLSKVIEGDDWSGKVQVTDLETAKQQGVTFTDYETPKSACLVQIGNTQFTVAYQETGLTKEVVIIDKFSIDSNMQPTQSGCMTVLAQTDTHGDWTMLTLQPEIQP